MGRRTIVVTGGSDGIGAHAARQLRRAQPNTRVILVGRSADKTAAVAAEIDAQYFLADYTRLEDVRALAVDIRSTTDHIDVLANNAGGVFGQRTVTVDGNEKTFQVNLLAPLLLTRLLIEPLMAGGGGVINTSSASAKIVGKVDIGDLNHEKTYAPMRAYGDAKLANILFARGLDRHYRRRGITASAFDPGNVRTNFGAENNDLLTRLLYRTPLSRLALISPEEGGAHLAFFLAGTPGVDWEAGRFYARTKLASPRQTNAQVFDEALIAEFWRRASALIGLDED